MKSYVFAVPTLTHISYQIKTFLPCWIQQYIFFQKSSSNHCITLKKMNILLCMREGYKLDINEKKGREKERPWKGCIFFLFSFSTHCFLLLFSLSPSPSLSLLNFFWLHFDDINNNFQWYICIHPFFGWYDTSIITINFWWFFVSYY